MKDKARELPRYLSLALVAIGLRFSIAPAAGELIHHWPLDGDSTDVVGGYTNLTEFGDPVYISGQFGQAVSFDGNDCLVQTTAPDPIPAQNYTLTGWVYMYASYTGGQEAYIGGAQDCAYLAVRATDRAAFTSYRTNCDGPNSSLPLNVWTFVVGTSSDVDGLKVYVDNVLVGTNVVQGASDRNWFAFGARADRHTSSGYLNGAVDDFAVFDHVLTPDEMQNVMKYGADRWKSRVHRGS